MIAFVRGRVAHKGPGTVIVDVNGVGYLLAVSHATLTQVPAQGESAQLWTEVLLREDSLSLVGFATREERVLFLALTGVSGVGAKLALAILSVLPAGELRRVLLTEDVAQLTRVPGVGRKTAQRIILELRDKLAVPDAGEGGATHELAAFPGPSGDVANEAQLALTALGYSGSEAQAAVAHTLKQLGAEMSLEALVRHSLRRLAEGQSAAGEGRR